jgi:phosphohistidine phosphatase SixA
VQTAQEVARGLGIRAPVRECEALQPDAKPQETMHALKAWVGQQRMLAVGHEPHLSIWLAELVSGPREPLRCVIKKAGVACVDLDRPTVLAGGGTLRWLLTAKQMALIGKAHDSRDR